MENYYEGNKIFIDNGYPAIYLPSHPNCKVNGVIRIHILQMEKHLGRQLKKGEVVHHKDENKLNYALNNLMCFRSNSDHIAYHHGNEAYMDLDGTYYCVLDKSEQLCVKCFKPVTFGCELCRNCYNMTLSKIPSKNQLIDDISNMSFVSIGLKYGVSDNAVRKWCKKYNLPYKKSDIIKIFK